MNCKICGMPLMDDGAEICIVCYEDFVTGARRVGDFALESNEETQSMKSLMRLLKAKEDRIRKLEAEVEQDQNMIVELQKAVRYRTMWHKTHDKAFIHELEGRYGEHPQPDQY